MTAPSTLPAWLSVRTIGYLVLNHSHRASTRPQGDPTWPTLQKDRNGPLCFSTFQHSLRTYHLLNKIYAYITHEKHLMQVDASHMGRVSYRKMIAAKDHSTLFSRTGGRCGLKAPLKPRLLEALVIGNAP